jgi:hypothetical protein
MESVGEGRQAIYRDDWQWLGYCELVIITSKVQELASLGRGQRYGFLEAVRCRFGSMSFDNLGIDEARWLVVSWVVAYVG